MKRVISILALTSLVFAISLTSCKKDDEVILPSSKTFVGSDKCATCHGAIHETFIESGHPYKIVKVENGQQPNIPFMPTAMTPAGYTWNDLSYTIGGYGWKMRFIDNNGFVITAIDGSQWNPTNNSQSIYNSSTPNGTEKYTCGGCHTTGWKSVAEGGLPQDGLPGMDGQFFKGGIQCEGCHGEGNVHIAAIEANVSVPSGLNVVTNRTNELCAKCHYRRWNKGDFKQSVSGDWEMHRCQVEQLSTNAHNSLTCIGCHDPHASTRKDNVAKGNGIRADKTCVNCHTDQNKFSPSMHYSATCINCHMPRAVKNAIKYTKYMADAPNHNFKINTSETDTYITTDADGSWANLNGKGTTLDYVCYQCHQDPNGDGGTLSVKTRAELTAKAVTFHK